MLIITLVLLILYIANVKPEVSQKIRKKCGKGTNFQTDLENCGGCGIKCPKDSKCHNGKCICDLEYKRCGKLCVKLAEDINNCGECGKKCEGACINGACKSKLLGNASVTKDQIKNEDTK